MSRIITGVADAQQRGNATLENGNFTLLREFAASGISVGCANTFLNPIEVIKIRMQLAGAAAPQAAAATAAQAVSAPSFSAAAAVGGPTQASLIPSAGRYFSHTSAYRGVSTPAAPAGTAGHLVFPNPSATAAAVTAGRSAAAGAAASADQALSATLQAATIAIQQPHTSISSSSSRLMPGLSTAQGLTCVTQQQGFIATAGLILREEGPTAFTRGIQASATRAVLNGGIRLGLYDPIKTLMSVDGSGRDLHMGQKLAAGSLSGGIGAVLTTPIELAKTRLQAPSAATRSMSVVLRGVIEQQGVRGLWRGATPSVLRLIMLNGSMCGTYDEVKGRIRTLTGWTSGNELVLASSMIAGLVTTTVINPADVARSYMQTGRGSSLSGVVRDILAREGPRGFFKGWTAAYCRTGPQTLIIFTVSEMVRPLFGLNVIGGSG